MTLSPRQREIVELVGRDGLSYKGVARSLGISVHTVRTHVEGICRRTETDGRPPREHLILLYARELGPRSD